MAASQGHARRFANPGTFAVAGERLRMDVARTAPGEGAGVCCTTVPGLCRGLGGRQGCCQAAGATNPICWHCGYTHGNWWPGQGRNDADSLTLLLCVFVTLSQFSHSFVLNYLLISFPSSSICSLSRLLSHLLFLSFAAAVCHLISFFHSFPS